jgi:hypothetical protein
VVDVISQFYVWLVSNRSLDIGFRRFAYRDKAFENCSGIVSVSFDSSVQSIGSKAFSGCVAVESISTKTPTPPVCSDNTFEGVPSDITITVPMASVENYRSAAGWNRFSNFVGRY